jgi:regulator of cell morphogenesis and NO signaling
MNYTEKSTLAEIVKNDINTAKIFESYGLDFCCNGKRPLDEACHEKNLEPKKILDEISAKTDNNESADFNSMDIKDLTDYIIGKHHEYIRNIIPTIRSFGEKVVRAHSANHSEVKKIAELYMRVSIDLENHLMKEENILFP